MPVCSPALSLCGIIVSIWGIIQLVLMGFFYYIHSVALAEDIPLPERIPTDNYDIPTFYKDADKGYKSNAFNCWIAACLYIITLLFSGHQFYLNGRTSVSI